MYLHACTCETSFRIENRTLKYILQRSTPYLPEKIVPRLAPIDSIIQLFQRTQLYDEGGSWLVWQLQFAYSFSKFLQPCKRQRSDFLRSSSQAATYLLAVYNQQLKVIDIMGCTLSKNTTSKLSTCLSRYSFIKAGKQECQAGKL